MFLKKLSSVLEDGITSVLEDGITFNMKIPYFTGISVLSVNIELGRNDIIQIFSLLGDCRLSNFVIFRQKVTSFHHLNHARHMGHHTIMFASGPVN